MIKPSLKKIKEYLDDNSLNIEGYKKLVSTNIAAKDKPVGTVIIADLQTGGKGRRGKSFYSPRGGIYMSIVLDAENGNCDKVTIAAAVAVRRAVFTVTGEETRIKWVNDLLFNGKKVCGILAESETDTKGEIKKIILGIGVNHYIKKFPKQLPMAGSLRSRRPPRGEKERLISALIKEVFVSLREENIIDEYKKHCTAIGKKVTFPGMEGVFTVVGIDSGGALILETGERVSTGDAVIN